MFCVIMYKKVPGKLLNHFEIKRYMKTTDKGEEQWVVETSNEHNFLSNKAFLTILSALESLDNEVSENFKNFQFLVLFCIQNGI